MTTHALAARTPAGQLREARRQWLQAGELRAGLLEPSLHASWTRSRQYGLMPDARTPGTPHASSTQLSRALEHRRALVAHARPVMEFLCEQIRDTDSIIILADSQGMLLHSMGDLEFSDKAARVALRPGAIWHEQWRGTNAIGTAIAAAGPVVVHGAEHYLERNSFLTCAAAPISDSTGQVLGVIDISGDHRGYHRHTLGLVRSAARMIEHPLFESRHVGGMRVRLHLQPQGVGTVMEGLLAVAEDGSIVGANEVALSLLGLTRAAIGTLTLEQVLAAPWTSLVDGPSTSRSVPRAAIIRGSSTTITSSGPDRSAIRLAATTAIPHEPPTSRPSSPPIRTTPSRRANIPPGASSPAIFPDTAGSTTRNS